MKFYSVYKKSQDLLEKCVLVKKGFVWQHFFFGVFWALYKRIWDLVLIHILFMLSIKLAVMFFPIFRLHITVIATALQLIISFYVNSLLEKKLIDNGYKKLDFVAGDNEELALLRFLSNTKKS